MKGAEELAIHKALKKEYGGGMKEFVYDEAECFEGVGDSTTFLTSQERQSIVKHMLFNLRAVYGDQIQKIHFLEGQPLGKCVSGNHFHFPGLVGHCSNT